MARAIKWTPRAAEDLESACEYLARDSEAYARDLSSRVIRRVESLGDLSERGRRVPEVGRDDIREVFVHRYRLIYRVEADIVRILALVHGAQLFSNNRLEH